MVWKAVGGTDRIRGPIKHLRRGVEIQVICPKVSSSLAATATTAVSCTELVEVASYSAGFDGTSGVKYARCSFVPVGSHRFFRRRQISWNAVSSGNLVELEIYVRAAVPINQGVHRINYELSSVCVVEDNALQL